MKSNSVQFFFGTPGTRLIISSLTLLKLLFPVLLRMENGSKCRCRAAGKYKDILSGVSGGGVGWWGVLIILTCS